MANPRYLGALKACQAEQAAYIKALGTDDSPTFDTEGPEAVDAAAKLKGCLEQNGAKAGDIPGGLSSTAAKAANKAAQAPRALPLMTPN